MCQRACFIGYLLTLLLSIWMPKVGATIAFAARSIATALYALHFYLNLYPHVPNNVYFLPVRCKRNCGPYFTYPSNTSVKGLLTLYLNTISFKFTEILIITDLFDSILVNMQQVIAAISQPTPTTLSSIPANAPCTTTVSSNTPNVSGIFNTSSNTSWVKTPRDRSLLPDSRGSSHSGRLLRITPSHTPGGIAAPSPTVNTKEALGTIMAMLNNPLEMDEAWSRPAAAASQMQSSSIHQQKFTFENEFAKGAFVCRDLSIFSVYLCVLECSANELEGFTWVCHQRVWLDELLTDRFWLSDFIRTNNCHFSLPF